MYVATVCELRGQRVSVWMLEFMNGNNVLSIMFKFFSLRICRYALVTAVLLMLCLSIERTAACTSAIVSAKASADGRPFIWKHRDTGTEQNFIERVESPGCLTFVALFNGGDRDLRDAWLGMNEAGLMVMNTASYNLAPDTARLKDMEGVVMRRALEVCRTVQDFRNLLDTLPRPMGVQANFGVLDRNGDGGYFETDDVSYTPFMLSDTVPYLVRTNFSVTGNDTDGYGYIRYDNACHLLGDMPFRPEMLTEGLSRSFYHSRLDKDMATPAAGRWVIDQDFIPRYSSTASVVMVNGLGQDEEVMFATLGYPPVGELFKITINNVPDDVRPVDKGYTAPANNRALVRKRKAFPVRRGSGKHYIDMDYVRGVSEKLREENMKIYQDYYSE